MEQISENWERRSVRGRLFARVTLLGGLALGLSACGHGYAGGSYGGSYASYDCNPYDQYDSYYSCDSGYGFYNIGYGGGWWNNYYYPGYGLYIFDRGGSRYLMQHSHRRYWGHRRHIYARDRRRNGGNRNYNGNGRGHHHSTVRSERPRNGAGRGRGQRPVRNEGQSTQAAVQTQSVQQSSNQQAGLRGVVQRLQNKAARQKTAASRPARPARSANKVRSQKQARPARSSNRRQRNR